MSALACHRWGKKLLIILLALPALLLTSSTGRTLESLYRAGGSAVSEELYLPSEQAVSLLSFGYKRALSSYLWFRTINYFGKHYAGDQQYRWLYLMCDLVTTLDPKALHVYEFGSNILAWEANSPQDARQLLSKGIEHNRDFWKLYYLRGFITLYFLNDPETAKKDFVTASGLPDVHPIVVGLAAKSLALQDDPDQAVEFLTETLRSSDDPNLKQVLMERLRELSYERDLRRLERALKRYTDARGGRPATIEELAPFLDAQVSLSDPYGGSYLVDQATGQIKSSSNHKRLDKKNFTVNNRN